MRERLALGGMADRPRTVALLGGGVIGGGWAARFLLNGIDVRLYDPDPGAGRAVGGGARQRAPRLRRLTLAPLPAEGALTRAATVEEAVEGADFVQESAPEREELKRALLAAASRAAGPDVVIASSTSGLLPSRLQADMAQPERLASGIPFNPVYLLPLVELCGGERTAPETRRARGRDLPRVGMRPLVLRREVDAFVADRLLEALWREALWLVADDVATVEEIDDAIRFGAGLRWAFMGTFLTLPDRRRRAGHAPLPGPVRAGAAAAVDAAHRRPRADATSCSTSSSPSPTRRPPGRSLRELERVRDDCLVAVIQGLRTHGVGAGAVLAELRARAARRAPGPATPTPTRRGPLRLHAAVVPPEWVDYNGHAHESRYLQVFGDATDALLRAIGVDAAYLAAGGSYFTVETHLSHLGQARAEERLHVTTQLLGHDEKRLHLFHALHRSGRRRAAGHRRADAAARRHGAPSAPRRPRRRCSRASRGSPRAHAGCRARSARAGRSGALLANLARSRYDQPHDPGGDARGQDEALAARRARRGRRGDRHRAEREAGRAPGARG